MQSRAPGRSHRPAAAPHGAPRYERRSPPTRTGRDRLLHRSESARTDEAAMRGFLHLTERNKTNVVRLAHLFERPANAHVTRQSPAAIGRPFKSGDRGGHLQNHPHRPGIGSTNGVCVNRHRPAIFSCVIRWRSSSSCFQSVIANQMMKTCRNSGIALGSSTVAFRVKSPSGASDPICLDPSSSRNRRRSADFARSL